MEDDNYLGEDVDYVLARIKRNWCPEWLWRIFAWCRRLPLLGYVFEVFDFVFTKKVVEKHITTWTKFKL